MPHTPEYALITPNTLEAAGLEQLLRRANDEKIIVRHFADFPTFADDTPDMYACYFISSQTYVLYNPFFSSRKDKTIILMHGTGGHSVPQGIRILNLELSLERLTLELERLLAPRSPLTGLASEENDLSTREIEVLILICKGLINKEIADKLHISLTTVITHRKNITEKLGIKSVSGLTIYAVMNGYIEPDSI